MSHISRDHCVCQHNKLNNTKSQVTQDMSGRISLQAAGASRAAVTRDIETATRSIPLALKTALLHAHHLAPHTHTHTSRQSAGHCVAARQAYSNNPTA